MNTAGNLICGQVTGETARLVSTRFHANVYLKTTVSVNSSDTSINQTEVSEEAVTPATLAQLSSGEFIGVVQPLPIITPVTTQTIKENFSRIGREIEEIVAQEMKRFLGDPGLKKYIVRR